MKAIKFTKANCIELTLGTTPDNDNAIPELIDDAFVTGGGTRHGGVDLSQKPKFLRVAHNGDVGEYVKIALGPAGVTILAAEGLMVQSGESVLLDVSGFQAYAVVASAADVVTNLVFLDNY